MDQLRVALAWLQRQHFLVLTGLVALIAVGCWWSASGKLSKAYRKDETTITTEFKNVQHLRDDPFHPNADVNAKQSAETKKQAESVAKLWQQLYDRQRDAVLKWPSALSQEFRDYVEKLQFGDDIRPDLRSNYQNYIEQHFPELPKKIKAPMMDVSEAPGAGGFMGRRSFSPEGPGGAGFAPDQLQDDNDYVCEWLDQNVIREELDFPQRPSSLRIWLTQEDLWVYETLLDVIANTNGAVPPAGATRMSNAAVKTIYSLEVGQRSKI